MFLLYALHHFAWAGAYLMSMRRCLLGMPEWKALGPAMRGLLFLEPGPCLLIALAGSPLTVPMASCSAAELYLDMSFQFCWAVSPGPGCVSLSLSPSVQSLLGRKRWWGVLRGRDGSLGSGTPQWEICTPFHGGLLGDSLQKALSLGLTYNRSTNIFLLNTSRR